MKRIEHIMESFIFGGRWLLAPMYVGLILGEFIYVYKFLLELWQIFLHFYSITQEELLLAILGLVDISMIGALIAMITIGGYSIFVKEIIQSNLESRPRWLNNISPGTLKIKMCMSLVGVTSIHLLKTFINVEHLDRDKVYLQILIHVVFLASTLVMTIVERISHPHKGKENESH